MPENYVWPLKRANLEDYYEMCTRDANCNYCKWVYCSDIEDAKFAGQCPKGQRYKFDTFFAQGLWQVARKLMENEFSWNNDTVRDVLYTCTSCGACEEWCSYISGMAPLKLHEELRIRYVENVGPHPRHKALLKSLDENHNAYDEPHEERFEWMPKGITPLEKAEIIYFAGCSNSYRQKEMAKATVQVLDKLGVKFGILWENEWCCGSPGFRTGNLSYAKKLMDHNITALKKAGAKTLLSGCGGCIKSFSEAWKYGLDVPVKSMDHVTTFLESRVKKLAKEKKLNKVELKIAYHDPCHLGRGLGVYEPGREILKSIPGVEVLELPRNRKNSWCCGSGGGVKSAYPDLALWTAQQRLDEVEYVGAKNVAAPCPFCIRNLGDAAKELNRGIEVLDVMEILQRAL
jgi:heterodisulfide reductase subunit D